MSKADRPVIAVLGPYYWTYRTRLESWASIRQAMIECEAEILEMLGEIRAEQAMVDQMAAEFYRPRRAS